MRHLLWGLLQIYDTYPEYYPKNIQNKGLSYWYPFCLLPVMKTTLLIIDEDKRELLRLRKIFSREGYNLMTATNIETALNICRNIKVDYVLGSRSQWLLQNKINDQLQGDIHDS